MQYERYSQATTPNNNKTVAIARKGAVASCQLPAARNSSKLPAWHNLQDHAAYESIQAPLD
jgi:hypothetical protein